MILRELKRLMSWEERHRRLVSRLVLVLVLTAIVDAIGTVLVFVFERHTQQTDIHSFFEAFFFTTVQLLTVSSSLKNPISVGGRVVDVFLELWAVLVVTAVAGSFSSFFGSADSE
jgi:hypothetical protein